MKVISKALSLALVIGVLPNMAVKAQEKPTEKTTMAANYIFPFDANGYCWNNCPPLPNGYGATVSSFYISMNVGPLITSRVSFVAPATLLNMRIGIDNDGYSNWWTAEAFLVSDASGQKVGLGKLKAENGNQYSDIGISCKPEYNLNPCYPSMNYGPVSFERDYPVGSYSIEVVFTDKVTNGGSISYLFGPAIFTVIGNTPDPVVGIQGSVCKKKGAIKKVAGISFACVAKGKKSIWTRIN